MDLVYSLNRIISILTGNSPLGEQAVKQCPALTMMSRDRDIPGAAIRWRSF